MAFVVVDTMIWPTARKAMACEAKEMILQRRKRPSCFEKEMH